MTQETIKPVGLRLNPTFKNDTCTRNHWVLHFFVR